MRILTLQFSAKINTNFGEQVFICGNVSQLGNWQPTQGLKLYTDSNMYPNWNSFRFIHIRESTLLEFKLCICTYHGHVIRWQSLPSNGNRRLVASMNMGVCFQQGIQDLQISRIDPTPRISCRKKTLEILNDLDSDSSSSKQFWKDYMDQDDDTPMYYRNFVSSMRRMIESQGEQQISIRFNQQTTNVCPSLIEYSIDYLPENYFIVFNSGSDKKIQIDNSKQRQNLSNILQSSNLVNNDFKTQVSKSDRNDLFCQKQKSISENVIRLRDEEVSETAQKIKYLANAIISSRQFILVAHLYLKNKKLLGCETLLKIPMQWKTVIHLPKQLIGQCLKIIEYGVNMIVLEDEESLKQAFSLVNTSGFRLKMVKPLLYMVQLYHYRQTYIYCSTCAHQEFIENVKFIQGNEYGQKIKKINELLLMRPHFPTQHALMKSITDNERNIFSKIKFGKRVVIITTNNVKNISQKVMNSLINLAGRRNHQVYIIQQEKLTGVEKCVPISSRDRMMVINTAGQMYASGQRTPTLYETLSLSPRRISEMYDSLIKSVGADSHCTIKNTKKNTLLIQFTADQIGQCVKKFITDSIVQMNLKSLVKLVIVNKDQANTIEIRPFCTSTDFYIKSIINGSFKIETYSKNLLLCIDYQSEQRSLNLIERALKNHDNILYQGFYCEKKQVSYTNFCRPMITQANFSVLLETLIQQSHNVPWLRSPSGNTQTDVQ